MGTNTPWIRVNYDLADEVYRYFHEYNLERNTDFVLWVDRTYPSEEILHIVFKDPEVQLMFKMRFG